MKYKNFPYYFLILTFLLINCKKDVTVYKAEKGILDLRNWDPEKESVLSLDGTWEFYWKNLRQASELSKLSPD